MDVGDIIYYILILFFLVFGFISKSKKKNDEKQAGFPENPPPVVNWPPQAYKKAVSPKNNQQPPLSPPVRKRGFESSLDLVTDFEGESSLKDSIYVKDSDFFDVAPEKEETAHPILNELKNNGVYGLKKAVVFSEILNRKY